MIEALAALGVFFAVPLTGRVLVGRLELPVPRVAWPSVWIAGGLAVWSIPLLGSIAAGIFSPQMLGVAGWISAVAIIASRRVGRPRLPRLPRWDWLVVAGLVAAAVIAAAFPDDPFAAHGDIAEYANHAVWMANHGRLTIPYPWDMGVGTPDPLFGQLGHLYPTQPELTSGFGHLFPAWLAQVWGATGYEGLVRVNVLVGSFALLAVYGLLKRVATRIVAAVAVLLVAFNPAQIWIVQQTLTEVLTELFIWVGLLLLCAYLVRGGRRLGIWAGVMLGISAFVRIDAFLILPFLLLGHALWTIVRTDSDASPATPWQPIYVGALTLFAAAFAYFALFSRPYLLVHASHVATIGALTLISLVGLLLTRNDSFRSWAKARTVRGFAVPAFLVALTALAVYAYFIRPIVPPFATYEDPLQGGTIVRTRVEEALANLGRYLTPGVVWAGFIGWCSAFVAALRKRRLAWLLPLLVISLGITAVYAWNQSSVPYHFVAIRRFIPVIIPAFVVFFGLAATLGLRRLSPSGRKLATWSVTALLIVFTAWIGVPTYGVSQRQGAYEALREVAESIPSGEPVIALGGFTDSGALWLPLYLAFDKPVTPVDITTQEGLTGVVDRLRTASPDHPVTILSAKGLPLAPVEGEVLSDVEVSVPIIDNYAVPVPASVRQALLSVTLAKATGLNTIGAELMARPQWLTLMGGVFGERLTGDGTVRRGTGGHAQMVVPIEGDRIPDTLSISIAESGPTGGSLRLLVNGQTVFDGHIPAGQWSSALPIPPEAGLRLGETALVEIISDTFIADPSFGYADPVGVEVSHISFERAGD